MSERDFTPSEVEALEELGDVSQPDLAKLRSGQVVSEAISEAQRQEHVDGLLGMIESAPERRQEQDRALVDLMFRAQASPEPEEG